MSMNFLAAIERVTLVNPGGSAESFAFWIWTAGIVVGSVAVGGLISYFAWRDAKTSDPEERAFRHLAGRLGVSPADRRLLSELASGAGIPAVALLLSEGAFDRAMPVRRDSGLSDLRRRLFSDR